VVFETTDMNEAEAVSIQIEGVPTQVFSKDCTVETVKLKV
jgi:hypothetical protein